MKHLLFIHSILFLLFVLFLSTSTCAQSISQPDTLFSVNEKTFHYYSDCQSLSRSVNIQYYIGVDTSEVKVCKFCKHRRAKYADNSVPGKKRYTPAGVIK